MQFLKDAHLNVKHHFEKGGKLEFFYPIWEAQFTGLFTPGDVTRTASHVRDGLDNKRLMITVVIVSDIRFLTVLWYLSMMAMLFHLVRLLLTGIHIPIQSLLK